MVSAFEISSLLEKYELDPLSILRSLGGFYRCGATGPLVGYAGTYSEAGVEKQYVGKVYANFATAERHPQIIAYWARMLWDSIITQCHENGEAPGIDVFMGAPEGGKKLAYQLALESGRQYIHPDERRIPGDGHARARKEFFWGRHEIEAGSKVAIVEDVANNFSTTKQLIDLVRNSNAQVVRLVCLLNRSPSMEDVFTYNNPSIPITNLVREPMPEYKQSDPEVRDLVASGLVAWKPKDEWDSLVAAMRAADE